MSRTFPEGVTIREAQDQPRGEEGGAASLDVKQGLEEWKTPGSLIARALLKLPQVRLVAERYEGGRYGVFVILDDDSDEVLDRVFEAEEQTMRELPRIPFDLRVRKPHPEWSEDNLLATCVKRYSRP